MSLRSVLFLQSPVAPAGLFDHFFGGLFLLKGIPLLGHLGVLVCFALALGAALLALRGEKHWARVSFCASTFLFVLLWLFLLQPWDELFINLRHAQHFAENGHFSFNRSELLEGTVDFLPYVLVAATSKLGIPIVEGAFLMSLGAGLLCLFLAFRFFRVWKLDKAAPLAVFVLTVFAPLGFNASQGFATTFFAAGILAAILFLFYEKRIALGLCLLAILPLIRVEAFLLVTLLLAFWLKREKKSGIYSVAIALGVFFPAAVHAFLRWRYFGEYIPLPVQFKSTGGNLFFLFAGVRNLVSDAIATHTFAAILVLAALHHVYRIEKSDFPLSNKRHILSPAKELLIVLFLFCLPYYSSGGDWFPSYWGRYLFPFTLFLILTTLAVFYLAMQRLPFKKLAASLALPICFFLFSSLWPISSSWKFIETVLSHRRTLAQIHEPTIARGHYRVQHLSQLGEHLRATTLPTDRIGSSELATIMFYADREGVDYLGLVNPEIARSPLRPLPSLLRKFPYRSELPFLIFKKMRPDLLEKTQPEILYTFDFMLRDQMKDVRPYELTPASLIQALGRWEKQLGGLVDALYGGIPKIQELGYQPVVVQAGEDFLVLYFVHARILERHLQTLAAQGFKGVRITCTHLAGPCEPKTDGLQEKQYK